MTARGSRVAEVISTAAALALTIAVNVVAPSLGLVTGLTAGLALLAWWTPVWFTGAGLLLMIMAAMPDALLPGALSFLDEVVVVVALVVLTLRRVTRRRLPRVPPWSLWFFGFLALGLVSALAGGVPSNIALEGAFLALKGVIFGIAVAQIEWRPRDLRPLAVGGAVVVVLLALASLVNLVAPHWWTRIVLGAPQDFDGLLGIPSLIGPFQHPAALGRLCVVLAIAVLSWRLCVGRSWRSAVVLALAAAPAVLSFRVKSLVSLGVGAITVGAINASRFTRRTILVAAGIALIVAVPVVGLAIADFTKYFVDESARSLLTWGSVDVAARTFPLGVGFGRYGSFTASAHYSPEYVRLGFESVYGLRSTENGGQFLTDTQWPAILGETGWAGAIVYAAGLVHIGAAFARRLPAGSDPLLSWVRTMGIGWLVVMVVESVAAPVFVSPPTYPLLFAAAGVYAAMRASDLLIAPRERP